MNVQHQKEFANKIYQELRDKYSIHLLGLRIDKTRADVNGVSTKLDTELAKKAPKEGVQGLITGLDNLSGRVSEIKQDLTDTMQGLELDFSTFLDIVSNVKVNITHKLPLTADLSDVVGSGLTVTTNASTFDANKGLLLGDNDSLTIEGASFNSGLYVELNVTTEGGWHRVIDTKNSNDSRLYYVQPTYFSYANGTINFTLPTGDCKILISNHGTNQSIYLNGQLLGTLHKPEVQDAVKLIIINPNGYVKNLKIFSPGDNLDNPFYVEMV